MKIKNIEVKKLTIDDFIKRKKDQLFSEYRFKSKGCFIKGTAILTNKGFVNIEDIVPPVNAGFHTPYNNKDLQIKTRLGYEKIESTYYDLCDSFIEIELDNGDIIEVTEDHTMIIIREGVEIKVDAKDLLETDKIMSN
ncbi:MAG: hypothetical protein JXM74_07870 [Fusobacteriaceae bacterium]|nr:hypothetical protein [Fusobacteriaceae bacterium]